MRIILLSLFVLSVSTPSQVELFRDDFSKFPPGWLSKPVGLLNGAIQEYHYLPHRGVATFPWYNPITHNDSWVAGDEDGKTYLEQHLPHDQPARLDLLADRPELGLAPRLDLFGNRLHLVPS